MGTAAGTIDTSQIHDIPFGLSLVVAGAQGFDRLSPNGCGRVRNKGNLNKWRRGILRCSQPPELFDHDRNPLEV
jgi:hypothetical protein